MVWMSGYTSQCPSGLWAWELCEEEVAFREAPTQKQLREASISQPPPELTYVPGILALYVIQGKLFSISGPQ